MIRAGSCYIRIRLARESLRVRDHRQGPCLERQRLEELRGVYRDGLLDDVLPFWTRHAVDREHGGFMTALDRDGSLLDTDKSMWQQGRFSWLLGKLYNCVETRPQWLELCRHGIEFLDAHAVDPADGRMWFQVTREGRPIRKRRYAFTEAFSAIAHGEYAKASGDARAADAARQAFAAFTAQFLQPAGEPKYTEERPTRSFGFPMICMVTAQELRESILFEEADAWIDRSIEMIERFHVKPEHRCVMETVGIDGEILDHFDGRTLNPGHAIEGAWFMMREGRHRGDAGLVDLGCRMLDWMWERGWDAEHGGIFYFRDLDGKPVQDYWHDMKFWWPQSEAITATLMAYRLTGETRHADRHRQIHDWAHARFPDADHGEWFGYLHRDGRLSVGLKGNLWKGPFHVPRMQLVCWQLIEELLQADPG